MSRSSEGASENPGPELLKQYFDIVEQGNYQDLREVFSEEALYRHPMVDGKLRGVDAIVQFFSEEMDAHETFQDRYHEFEDFVREGNRCVGIGRVTDGTLSTYFISYVKVDDGRISYYTPGVLDESTVLDIIGESTAE